MLGGHHLVVAVREAGLTTAIGVVGTTPAATGALTPVGRTGTTSAVARGAGCGLGRLRRPVVGVTLGRAIGGCSAALTRFWVCVRCGGQGDLSVGIDVVDRHLEILAQLEHVLDLVDAPATSELGDVHQAVTTRKDVDEGTELGDVDHLARVDRTDLCGRRIEDQLDLTLSLVDGSHVDRGDRNDSVLAVVVDTDVGSGLGLDRVDHLALGPDDLTDLVGRDLDADDLGRCLGELGAWAVECLGHDPEDLQSGVTGLIQRRCQDIGGDAVDLGVELQRRDHVGGTGDLEVHVAEGVLGSEDVGEGGVLAVRVHQAHGDSRNGRLDGNTGVHERKTRGTDRRHRAGTVGAEHLGDQADGVGEVLERGHHGEHCTLGERTVADLTPLRSTHEPGFAGGEGREVVVVHVALAGLGIDPVDHLVHPLHPEGAEVEDLGVAALEQPCAVCGRYHRHLRRQRADVCGTTTVDPHAIVDDPAADRRLGEAANGTLDLLRGGLLVTVVGDESGNE